MSDDDLRNLTATLALKTKEAKRKLSALLKNDRHLESLWVEKLGIDPPKALPEEVIEIKKQRQQEFEMALFTRPEAFVAYQINALLVQLGNSIRQERCQRALEKRNGANKSQECP